MDRPSPEKKQKKLDTPTLWRAALLQLAAVVVLSIALATALPHDFFVNWGWIAGPGAWMLCAAFTARVLALPLVPTLIGAVLAGLPSLVAVLVNLHWAGAVLAVGLFALWCAWLPRAKAMPS
ncbi:MAG TPA: hypothetical protein VHM66_05110 [Solirubrobacterales bacterium]|nr:hypothetical protein [Solirubrobacterales bacterium]